MTQALSEPRNRLVQVIESAKLNGIDFIELKSVDATTLYVHFLNTVNLQVAGIAATISGGDRIQGITVEPINNATDWTTDADGRPILVLRVSQAGDFSTYTLTLSAPQLPLDPLYQSTTFSFKVLCPSDFDCQAKPICCTAPEPPLPAIDYLAKDFKSFKQALTDFSAQRYPAWQERSEADFGMMFMEALCALADEFSYLQDRVAAEAALPTATQRRSLLTLARLVDYEPQPVISATTTLQCNVVGNTVPAGTLVTASRPDGVVVPFEIGSGLSDSTTYAVSPSWNAPIQPYWFDDSQQCLPCHSTSMWLLGHGFQFQLPDSATGTPGTALLIQTDLPGESIREVVHVTLATEGWDQIFEMVSSVTLDLTGTAGTVIPAGSLVGSADGKSSWATAANVTIGAGGTAAVTANCRAIGPIGADSGTLTVIQTPVLGWATVTNLSAATLNSAPTPVTQITWAASEATMRDHDLTHTILAGNLLPATQGERFSEAFCVGAPPPGSHLLSAIARQGPNFSEQQPIWIIRYPLSRTSSAFLSSSQVLSILSTGAQPRLTWLPPNANAPNVSTIDPDVAKPLPELTVNRRRDAKPFTFANSLLDATSAEPAFTVDPAAWRVLAFDAFGNPTQWEYDSDAGDTLRFGDGTFGATPAEGDVFDVQYRVGLGAAGNVMADAISTVPSSSSAYLSGVRNPFVVKNGANQETALHIQRMAPQAFRAVPYRAVRPEDYEAAADTLPWVLRAGTSFRWTGSWLTVFTTVDPRAAGTSGANVTLAEQTELIELLNRRRLAGYESYAPPPSFVSIDLIITVCVTSGWLESDVEQAVLSRLADAVRPDGTPGFFYADSFTFGTPLYRSNLEAAIQSVLGVNGVLDIQYRQRGASNVFQDLQEVLSIGAGEILRVANDPNFPERGTIRVIGEGGR